MHAHPLTPPRLIDAPPPSRLGGGLPPGATRTGRPHLLVLAGLFAAALGGCGDAFAPRPDSPPAAAPPSGTPGPSPAPAADALSACFQIGSTGSFLFSRQIAPQRAVSSTGAPINYPQYVGTMRWPSGTYRGQAVQQWVSSQTLVGAAGGGSDVVIEYVQVSADQYKLLGRSVTLASAGGVPTVQEQVITGYTLDLSKRPGSVQTVAYEVSVGGSSSSFKEVINYAGREVFNTAAASLSNVCKLERRTFSVVGTTETLVDQSVDLVSPQFGVVKSTRAFTYADGRNPAAATQTFQIERLDLYAAAAPGQ